MALVIRRRLGESIRIRSKDGARLIIEIEAGRSRSEIILRCYEPADSTERLELVRNELKELPWDSSRARAPSEKHEFPPKK